MEWEKTKESKYGDVISKIIGYKAKCKNSKRKPITESIRAKIYNFLENYTKKLNATLNEVAETFLLETLDIDSKDLPKL